MTADEALAVLQKAAVEAGSVGAGDHEHVAIASLRTVISDLADSLESTTWSSGCWCGGKDRRGHSPTCEARRGALRMAGRTPPGKDF